MNDKIAAMTEKEEPNKVYYRELAADDKALVDVLAVALADNPDFDQQQRASVAGGHREALAEIIAKRPQDKAKLEFYRNTKPEGDQALYDRWRIDLSDFVTHLAVEMLPENERDAIRALEQWTPPEQRKGPSLRLTGGDERNAPSAQLHLRANPGDPPLMHVGRLRLTSGDDEPTPPSFRLR